MTWAAFWIALSTVTLNILANEIFDVAPFLAQRILRRASQIEGSTCDEVELINAELNAIMAEVPGKLSKLQIMKGQG